MKAPPKFLVPQVAWPDLRRITCLAAVGAGVAGAYGMLHDQLTFALSPEYFTQLKFAQFQWAEVGLPPRGFVAQIGFLATWWVGFFATWFFARMAAPRLAPAALSRACARLWGTLAGSALACGALGFLLGPLYYFQSADWLEAIDSLQLADPQAFAQVAGIHLGGYLGALGGWLWAIFRMVGNPPRAA
jgi:hypothetical protein